MGLSKKNNDSRSFAMVDKNFWDSGLAAALGHKATFALLALARFMDMDYKCWPSQATLAKIMGCSEQWAGKCLEALLDFRFTNGEPAVRAFKRPNGKPGQSKHEYHVNPKCQISHGPDPVPLDLALVPPPKKQAPMNIEKAQRAAQAKRQRTPKKAHVQPVIHPSTTNVESGTSTIVESPTTTIVEWKNTHESTPNIRTLEEDSASPGSTTPVQATTSDSVPTAEPGRGKGAANHVRGVTAARDDAPDSTEDDAPAYASDHARDSATDAINNNIGQGDTLNGEHHHTEEDAISADDLLAWFAEDYRQRYGHSYWKCSTDVLLMQKLLDAYPGESVKTYMGNVMNVCSQAPSLTDVCGWLQVRLDDAAAS